MKARAASPSVLLRLLRMAFLMLSVCGRKQLHGGLTGSGRKTLTRVQPFLAVSVPRASCFDALLVESLRAPSKAEAWSGMFKLDLRGASRCCYAPCFGLTTWSYVIIAYAFGPPSFFLVLFFWGVLLIGDKLWRAQGTRRGF